MVPMMKTHPVYPVIRSKTLFYPCSEETKKPLGFHRNGWKSAQTRRSYLRTLIDKVGALMNDQTIDRTVPSSL